jgi:glycolate oxidase FAD binding subunit
MTMASEIANILGSENVKTDMASLAPYAIGGMVPSQAVLPSNASEVVEIVRRAAAENRAIVASGARTKLAMGLPPARYDIAVGLSRMNRVIAYDPADLTLSVEPGIPLAALNALLAEHGQMLPLSAPFQERATIGGTIASGVDGPLRQLYGTARDYLLGAEFVTGDGVLAKSGGRVVKNVTGYDMHKLLIGSMGTLGIITKLNFKTFPLPTALRTFTAHFFSLEIALNYRRKIVASPLRPLSLDIANVEVGNLLRRAGGLTPFAADEQFWSVVCLFDGPPAVIARYNEELKTFALVDGLELAGSVDRNPTEDGAYVPNFDFVSLVLRSSPGATVLKAGVPPTKMKTAIEAAEVAAKECALRLAVCARSIGVIYLALLPEDTSASAKSSVVKACAEIHSAVARLEGHATVPWCPDEWKSEVQVWGRERADWAEMRKVKNALDPQNILAQGRFVGGI